MINVIEINEPANDRAVQFVSDIYPKELKKKLKRSHQLFALVYWELIAQMAADTGRKMLKQRINNYRYANKCGSMLPEMEGILNDVKLSIDKLQATKSQERVFENIRAMCFQLYRIIPGSNSKLRPNFRANIDMIEYFYTEENKERIIKIQLDKYSNGNK